MGTARGVGGVVMRRELHRVFLVDLPEWESRGWRPAVTSSCGAVGASPFSAGLGAEVLIERELPDEPDVADPWRAPWARRMED